MLMTPQELRTVEIERANVADLEHRGDAWTLRAQGKNRNRAVYLRADVAEALHAYQGPGKSRWPTSKECCSSAPWATVPTPTDQPVQSAAELPWRTGDAPPRVRRLPTPCQSMVLGGDNAGTLKRIHELSHCVGGGEAA